MKYFLDTEFLDDGKKLDLISIAIVSEEGREFYAEVDPMDFDYSTCTDWLKENVIPHLFHVSHSNKIEGNKFIRDGGVGGLLTRTKIASEILRFLRQDSAIEFWGYFADYDWVI